MIKIKSHVYLKNSIAYVLISTIYNDIIINVYF